MVNFVGSFQPYVQSDAHPRPSHDHTDIHTTVFTLIPLLKHINLQFFYSASTFQVCVPLDGYENDFRLWSFKIKCNSVYKVREMSFKIKRKRYAAQHVYFYIPFPFIYLSLTPQMLKYFFNVLLHSFSHIDSCEICKLKCSIKEQTTHSVFPIKRLQAFRFSLRPNSHVYSTADKQ